MFFSHDHHLAAAVTEALLETAVRTRVAVGNAVLTVNSEGQAHARSGGAKGNRGVDAARAVAGLLEVRATLPGEPLRQGPGVDLGPDTEEGPAASLPRADSPRQALPA